VWYFSEKYHNLSDNARKKAPVKNFFFRTSQSRLPSRYFPLYTCPKFLSKDEFEETRLSDKKATLFSFSLDMAPTLREVTEVPVVLTIMDFEGGGRVKSEMTDRVVEEVKVGIPLEMSFRKFERQGDVPAYSWKCRPVR